MPLNEQALIGARLRTLSALSSPTAHELRGAASALALHLQLLAVDADDEAGLERRRRSLAIAQEERRRLFALAEVFVRHTVLPDARESDFDFAAATGDVVDLARPYAAHSRVELSLTKGPVAQKVFGRRDVVAQVLLELLLHLLDRCPRGSRLDVVVDTAGGAGVAAIHVPEGVVPDADVVAQAQSAMQWAGGTLRAGGGGTVLELPLLQARSSA